MPRHTSLIPYSHEHHEALVIALRLKKEGPTSPNDFGWPKDLWGHARKVLEFLDTELEYHFHKEENELFPQMKSRSSESGLIDDLLEEHKSMRASREMLRELLATKDEQPLRDHLKSLGVYLEAHVRKEERILFPAIERQLSN